MGLALALSGCKQEVQLTKAPPEGTLAVREPREPTIVNFPVPLDLQPFREEALRAIPERIVETTTWASTALCKVANSRRDCGGARIDITVIRGGDIALAVDSGSLVLELPVTFAVNVRGLAAHREIKGQRTGSSVLRIILQAGIKPGFVADVDPVVAVRLAAPTVQVLDLEVDLAQLIQPRIAAIGPQLVRSLAARLEQPSVQLLVARAWRALQSPVSIHESDMSWLMAEPANATSMGFVAESGQIHLRMGIATRFRHRAGEVAVVPGPARPPVIEPASTSADSTTLVISSWLSFEPMRAAIVAAAPRSRELDGAVQQRAEPIRSKLRDVHLYPSYGQLCIELSLDLIEPQRLAGRIGTLHLLAVPVVRAGSATMALDSIELAERYQTEKTYGVAVPSETPHPPATLEPYATLVAQAARMSVAREIQGVLPRINSIANRSLGDGITLTANFGHAVVDSIVPENADLKISYELTGTMTLRIDPAVATAVQRANDNRSG